MKKGLFTYIINHLIIIDNDVPDIDYSNINLIQFTGINGNGRI